MTLEWEKGFAVRGPKFLLIFLKTAEKFNLVSDPSNCQSWNISVWL